MRLVWIPALRSVGAITALLLLSAIFAWAQDSQFLFDLNGNLLVQTAEATAPPQILGQPQNQIVEPGLTASFFVVAADTRSLSYQWRFNGTNISGATNDALLFQNTAPTNEGQYVVVLTNPSGSVTSAPAMLWIDSDADGLPDSWEQTYFGNLTNTAAGDFDHDGVSNLQEFLDGTNPTNAASVLFHLTVARDGGSVTIVPDLPGYTNGQTVTLTATSSNETFHAWLGDIVTRSNPVTLVMTTNKSVYARFTPIVFIWVSPGSGDWTGATNWTPALIPGSNDIVFIDPGLIGVNSFTVTLNTNADCANFTLGSPGSSPTLTGSGTLTVRENLVWNTGTMSGSGRTVAETNANLSISGSVTLTGRELENGGAALWNGSGVITLNSSAIITNRAGASFNLQNGGVLAAGDAGNRFDNAGTFRKSVNGGTTTVQSGVTFNNSGTVELQSGTLVFNAAFTNSGAVNLSAGTTNLVNGGLSSGTFRADMGAVVEWISGTLTLGPAASLNGSGLYRLNGGNVTASADLAVGNLDLVSTFSTLSGTSTVSVATLMNWTAGTMSGGGRTIIGSGGVMNLGSSSSVTLGSRTVENAGTVLWTGSGGIVLAPGVITNRPGALFHAQNAAQISLGFSSGRFDNAGTFRKSVSTGTTTVQSGVSFNNFGTVELQSGTLHCNGNFTNNGAVTLSTGTTNRLANGGSASGTFTASANSIVEWSGGTFTLSPAAQLNGAGLYRLNGGNVTANPDLSLQNLDLVSAFSTLSGTSTVSVATTMNWTAGAMSGGGRTIIGPGAVMNLGSSSSPGLTGRTLENAGTVLWTGSGGISLSSGVITNRAGALFHAQNAAQLQSGGGANRFDNAGTFRKSASTATTTVGSGVSFTNSGTVDIRSGILAASGGYVSSSNALLNCALGGTTAGTNYGQLQVAGTVTLNGGLSVDLLPGYSPATNDSFTVVTAGTRSSTFTSLSYPSNRVTMVLSNSTSSVILRATDVLPIPQPVLSTPQILGPNVLLTWNATSNVTYRLENNPALDSSNWSAIAGDVTTLSNAASKLDVLTPSNRFYRVRVLP